MRIDMYFVY